MTCKYMFLHAPCLLCEYFLDIRVYKKTPVIKYSSKETVTNVCNIRAPIICSESANIRTPIICSGSANIRTPIICYAVRVQYNSPALECCNALHRLS